jgi:hypothetical protein
MCEPVTIARSPAGAFAALDLGCMSTAGKGAVDTLGGAPAFTVAAASLGVGAAMGGGGGAGCSAGGGAGSLGAEGGTWPASAAGCCDCDGGAASWPSALALQVSAASVTATPIFVSCLISIPLLESRLATSPAKAR